MEYSKALAIAQEVRDLLSPHCHRIEIAGSIRRKNPEVKDVEIVAVPKPYDIGLLESGIANVVNRWERVIGKLPCKYTRRILPHGIKLDLFFANEYNWGYIFAQRTGSVDFCRRILGPKWVNAGFKGEGGYLTRDRRMVEVREEEDLFKIIGIPFVHPEKRNI